jgi:hypothetical protein
LLGVLPRGAPKARGVPGRFERVLEVTSLVVIAIAILLGGRLLLLNLLQFRAVAALVLLVVFVAQLAALRRRVAVRGYDNGVRATRDVIFLVASLLALIELLSPQRWVVGAAVAAAEFGVVCELLARLVPVAS